ncbi:MAG: M20/M25/M40 family metallo-hydrolase, partial [Deltaproteobacteria bacterium]|nr:M20/M25/M40 family metallo-hydrolase [Deltaproteobacteria bacterium]
PRMNKDYERRRDVFVNGLNSVKGLRCIVPDGAFYAFCDLSGIMNGKTISDMVNEFLSIGIACATGTAFGSEYKTYVRFCFAASEEELKETVRILREGEIRGALMKYERLREEVSKELKTLIGFNSVSSRSNREIADYLENFYAGKGHEALRFSTIDKNGAEKVNVAAFVGKPPYSIIFSIHTDTVPPGDLALWKETGSDPWNPAEKDGKIFGLGASDTKGSIAVLNTLVNNRIFNPGKGLIAIFTHDEEVGLVGARSLLSGWKPPETVKYAVACEPTDNLVVTGQKGFAAFDLEIMSGDRDTPAGLTRSVKMKFKGQEAHASRPHQGRNAADVACGFFDRI